MSRAPRKIRNSAALKQSKGRALGKKSGSTAKVKRPQTLESFKAQYIRRLNDLHVGMQLTVAGLHLHRERVLHRRGRSEYHHFVVPSGGGKETARIRRNQTNMVGMLDQMIAEGERRKSLLMAVSLTEDYILNILKLVLRAHPERLSRGARGGDAETVVKLEDLLTKTRDDILEEKIQLRLNRALYASPADYLRYLGETLEIAIDPQIAGQFVETKATRDIVIHANGQANEKYVEKAGPRSRARPGQALPVDAAYLDTAFANMKALIVSTHCRLEERYQGDEAIERYVGRL